MHSRFLIPGAIALVLTSAPPAAADEDRTVWRVFVADQESGRVTAFDMAAPDRRWQWRRMRFHGVTSSTSCATRSRRRMR